jgi:glycosyltransferase involved in cell wall biosynthesis
MRILAAPAFRNRGLNPYNAALYSALAKRGVEVAEFSRLNVFLGRWDIVHLHWPDLLLHGAKASSTGLHLLYFLLRVFYARVAGARVFWTVHNLRAHASKYPLLEKCLWRWFLPMVDASIHLSESGRTLALARFPALGARPSFVIPHGHYRDAYPNEVDQRSAREKLGIGDERPVIGFVGQIRPYKNVLALARAFLALPLEATLVLAGMLDTSETELRAMVEDHPRVITRFGRIAEEDMQVYLQACDLLVFPFRDILNSGSVILALSFDRPVLIPAKGAMAEVQAVVGRDWVMTFDGELTPALLAEAVDWARSAPRAKRCDLAALDWGMIAEKTEQAYGELLARSPRT